MSQEEIEKLENGTCPKCGGDLRYQSGCAVGDETYRKFKCSGCKQAYMLVCHLNTGETGWREL